MAKQNKATFKAQQQALIDRTPPYDANPLIQKTEDDEVRDQNITNTYYETPTTGSITNPAAAFSVSFEDNEEFIIDLSGSINSSFVITINDLAGNVTGKLSIDKNSEQTVTFNNAEIIPISNTDAQLQEGLIQFHITQVDGVIKAHYLEDYPLEEWVSVGSVINPDYTVSGLNGSMRRTRYGIIEFRGRVSVTLTNAVPFMNFIQLTGLYIPSTRRGGNVSFFDGISSEPLGVTISDAGIMQSLARDGDVYLDGLSFAI